jgi:hypothetical protein
MATTTPNYGWTVPTSTDLVKDGATAIETLGDAIDASMNTALGTKKAGMVLLNTTSFSGVASQSFNNVFSSSYTNYKVIFQPTSNTVQNNLQLKLRASGTDSSTAYYFALTGVNSSGTSVNELGTNATSIRMAEFNVGNARGQVFIMEFFEPNLAQFTKINVTGMNIDVSNNIGSKEGIVLHLATTAYDGFSFIPSSATVFAGTIYIYGYNQ